MIPTPERMAEIERRLQKGELYIYDMRELLVTVSEQARESERLKQADLERAGVLFDSQAEIERLTAEVKQLKEHFVSISHMTASRDGMAALVDRQRAEIDRLTADASGVALELNEARNQLDRLTREKEELQKEERERTNALLESVEEVERLETEKESAEKACAIFRDQLEQCKVAFNRQGWETIQLDQVLACGDDGKEYVRKEKLEESEKACAEMRSVLEKIHKQTFEWVREDLAIQNMRKWSHDALSSSAGRGWVRREVLELCKKALTVHANPKGERYCALCREALAATDAELDRAK